MNLCSASFTNPISGNTKCAAQISPLSTCGSRNSLSFISIACLFCSLHACLQPIGEIRIGLAQRSACLTSRCRVNRQRRSDRSRALRENTAEPSFGPFRMVANTRRHRGVRHLTGLQIDEEHRRIRDRKWRQNVGGAKHPRACRRLGLARCVPDWYHR